MKKHNKLVRDRIPGIISAKGGTFKVHVADETEYREKLLEKLGEEYKEFLESRSDDELVDLLEIIYAIAGEKGISQEKLEELRTKKAEERGGFKQRIILEES